MPSSPISTSEAAILLWIIERPNHGMVDLRRGGLAEETMVNRVIPLAERGLLRFDVEPLFDTRVHRAISGVISIMESGVESFKSFLSERPGLSIDCDDVDRLLADRPDGATGPKRLEW